MPRTPLTKIVGYLRTSTDDQLLGIDAQEDHLRDIARRYACPIDLVVTEHESGGRDDRPELDRALRHARRIKAHLVVAKLDRLARDQRFLMKLVDGNVPILFGDLEDLDVSTPEARARGVTRAAANRTARAIEEQSDVAAIAAELRAASQSLRKIAAHLNAAGYPTRDGCQATTDLETGKTRGGWSAVQVKRVLDRIRPA
jgi:Resolvase, N terminal domain